ncbi:hypothetical protein [Dolichospermum phage Dfl-JY45]
MNGRNWNTSRGFTLLEMLVVLVIAGVVAAITFSQVRQRQANEAANTYVTLQAREMAIFGEAAQKFAEANKASWTVGARQEITTAQLVTAGHLPNTFAVRGGTAGASPIGETYRAFAIKDATNVARLVVADFGRAPTDALVRRAGYQVNATSLQGYKARVADEILKSTKGFAGYVQASTMTVRGVAGAFTQVLNVYFGNVAPTMPVAVELVGWPEYVRPGSSGPGPGGGGTNRSCGIVSGTGLVCGMGPNPLGRSQCNTTPDITHYLGHDFGLDVPSLKVPIPICATDIGVISTGVEGVALSYVPFTNYEMGNYDLMDWQCDRQNGHAASNFFPQQVQKRTDGQNIVINSSTVHSETCQTEWVEGRFNSQTQSCYWFREMRKPPGLFRVQQTTPVPYNAWTTLQPLQGLPVGQRAHTFYCM